MAIHQIDPRVSETNSWKHPVRLKRRRHGQHFNCLIEIPKNTKPKMEARSTLSKGLVVWIGSDGVGWFFLVGVRMFLGNLDL